MLEIRETLFLMFLGVGLYQTWMGMLVIQDAD